MSDDEEEDNPWREAVARVRRAQEQEAAERARHEREEQFYEAIEELAGPRPKLPENPTPEQHRLYEARMDAWQREARIWRYQLEALEEGVPDLGLGSYVLPPSFLEPQARVERENRTRHAAREGESPSVGRSSGRPRGSFSGITPEKWREIVDDVKRLRQDGMPWNQIAKRHERWASKDTLRRWLALDARGEGPDRQPPKVHFRPGGH